MPDRVSIRDLARLAGVSRTTVSLALRGSHEVSEATRKKILKLARKHDYRSHPAVNALMQQVGRGVRVHDEEVLAFIRSGRDSDERAPGPLEMLEGAREEAHRLGYRIEVFWAGYMAAKSEQLARVLYNRGIRGVIWSAMPYPHPPVVFPWEHFVPIACTQSLEVPRMPTINIHHAKGMARLIEELDRRGAKRIGFLCTQAEDFRQDFGWLTGIDLYHHRGGKAEVLSHLLQHPILENDIRAWLADQHPDVLILTHELFGLTQYLEGQIPRVSLDVPGSELGHIAGLHQNALEIGRHAVRSLALRLSNGILGLPELAYSIVSQASFVDGESLLPLRLGCSRSRAPRRRRGT